MLRSLKEFQAYNVATPAGDIGQVDDFYFDDQAWTVRYLVIDTGAWLSGRKVLVAATALEQPNPERQVFPVVLTQEQVANSPNIDASGPISHQQEIELHQYYGWMPYWAGGGKSPGEQTVSMPETGAAGLSEDKETQMRDEPSGNPHLRSANEVLGYHIQARDGEVGHVEDFISDDKTWSINYLVVDTRNWLPGKKVLVSPNWIEEMGWPESKVYINLARETIQNSPEYEPSVLLNQE